MEGRRCACWSNFLLHHGPRGCIQTACYTIFGIKRVVCRSLRQCDWPPLPGVAGPAGWRAWHSSVRIHPPARTSAMNMLKDLAIEAAGRMRKAAGSASCTPLQSSRSSLLSVAGTEGTETEWKGCIGLPRCPAADI